MYYSNMWLTIAVSVLLVAAFVSKACADDVMSEIKAALIQHSRVKNRNIQVYSGANSTNPDANEEDPISELFSANEERALTQFNQLSLATRYAGTGYNLIKGNPEGDFNYGAVDPGIKTTNEIFTHTYRNGKRVYYLGKAMQVPDQVKFHMSDSCAASHTVKAYSGRKSYMKELESSISVSGKLH